MFHVKHGIVACEANGICADAARAHKRVDTKVCPWATKPFFRAVRGLNEYHPLISSPFPLDSPAKIGERRLLEKGERQLDYSCVAFENDSQFTDRKSVV